MREQKTTFWRIADIGTFLGNSFKAILKGEFLLRLNIGRYFLNILYVFFLIAAFIWFSLRVETTMARVEKNKAELKELEIANSQKTFEVVSLTRRSTVQKSLQEMGSEVGEPTRPATVLTK